jgi:hypothetical protein
MILFFLDNSSNDEYRKDKSRTKLQKARIAGGRWVATAVNLDGPVKSPGARHCEERSDETSS